jgi:hypothetical protein
MAACHRGLWDRSWLPGRFRCGAFWKTRQGVSHLTAPRWLWFGGVVVSALVMFIQVRRQGTRAPKVVLDFILSVAVLFHPAWTIPAEHGQDCMFGNVQGSLALLGLLFIMLMYQVARVILVARRNKLTGVTAFHSQLR